LKKKKRVKRKVKKLARGGRIFKKKKKGENADSWKKRKSLVSGEGNKGDRDREGEGAGIYSGELPFRYNTGELVLALGGGGGGKWERACVLEEAGKGGEKV